MTTLTAHTLAMFGTQTAAKDTVVREGKTIKVKRDGHGRFAKKAGGGGSSWSKITGGDFTGLKQIGGRLGTTPAALYEADDGTKWYVKAQRSEDHANNEAAAAELYNKLYVTVPEVHTGTGAPGLGDGPQTASQWTELDEPPLDDPFFMRDVRRGFAADAWLGNWDAAGLTMDNIQSEKGFPAAVRVDAGGAMLFRAMGSPKGAAFGDRANEWDTLRDPGMAPQASRLFADMSDTELADSAENLNQIKPSQIRDIIAKHDLPPELAETLIARRADLLRRGELAALRAEQETNPHQPGDPATGRAALEAAPLRLQDQDWDTFNPKDRDDTSAIQSRDGEDVGLSPERLSRYSRLMRLYRGGTWRQIGAYMRGQRTGEDTDPTMSIIDKPGAPATKENVLEHVVDMMDAFDHSRLREPVTLWRGVGDASKIFGDAWGSNMVGATWPEYSPTSSSADVKVSRGFAIGENQVLMRLHVPAGVGAIQLSGWQTEHKHGNEAELALQPYLRYRVVGDTPGQSVDGGRAVRILDVEVEEMGEDEEE